MKALGSTEPPSDGASAGIVDDTDNQE